MPNDGVKLIKNMEDVNQAQVSSEQIPEITPVVVTPEAHAGDKTDSALLLESLQVEREKRRVLEEEVRLLKETPLDVSDEAVSDEGRALQAKINSLEAKFGQLEEDKQIASIQTQYPAIKDKMDEFNEFKQDYPRHKLESIAKLFLVEKGLLESTIVRKGLETATGGERTPAPTGMSAKDVKELRTTDFRKYQEMLMSGKLRPEDIH